MDRGALIAAGVMVWSSSLSIHAQEAPQESVEHGAPVADPVIDPNALHAGTIVHLRMLDTVASNTHKRGDRFNMEVVDAVVVEGREWIPAGAPAVGEVIDATKSGMGGNPGRLILSARFVAANDLKIALRSFTAGTGRSLTDIALGIGVTIGLPGLFITGKNMVVPKGTDVFAKTATDTSASILTDNKKTESKDER